MRFLANSTSALMMKVILGKQRNKFEGESIDGNQWYRRFKTTKWYRDTHIKRFCVSEIMELVMFQLNVLLVLKSL